MITSAVQKDDTAKLIQQYRKQAEKQAEQDAVVDALRGEARKLGIELPKSQRFPASLKML